MRYISIFSGIEAASVAWQPLGFEAVAFSEILPFQSAVLKAHYPSVPNLGDITQIDWSEYAGTVDIVVGGSPCQSFSSAGNWKEIRGLSGASGLMFEYIRAVREVRPRYFIWENVTGALTSEDGAAFGQLIAEMDELGYSVCWRVLDGQYFGVPQRRKRVFVIGHSGDRRASGAILFESETTFKPYKTCRRPFICASAECNARTHSRGVMGSTINRASPFDGPKCMGLYSETLPTITASYAPHVVITCDVATGDTSVHRLTPHEQERAFGFPDGYVSDVDFDGRKPTYREVQHALGNSFCVPVIKWIGKRLLDTDQILYQKGGTL